MPDEKGVEGGGGQQGARTEFKIRSREELAQLRRGTPVPNAGLNPDIRGNPTLEYKLQTIGEMGFDKAALAAVPKSVLSLTVNDLEDFAKQMTGLPVTNPRVNALTLEEVQGLEYLFQDNRQQVLATVAARLGDQRGLKAADVDVSCCCCTPCCCCAATETNPFGDEVHL